jgi:hypothetical protein
MSKFDGLHRRISRVRPSFPISGNKGNAQAGRRPGRIRHCQGKEVYPGGSKPVA